MIDLETQLKLQAYLDGELPEPEARKVAKWLDGDGEARALFTELQHARSLMGGGEVERSVPETREFYWSKIERDILAPGSPRPAVNPPALWLGWLRWAVPVVAAIALCCLAIPWLRQGGADRAVSQFSEAQEIETPLQQASFISFRSESDGMSVVWLDTY